MLKQILKNKFLVVAVLLLAFTAFYSADAFAWGGHGDHGHYHYRGGRWDDSGWFWGGFATALTIGTIIATLPPRYETVYVGGAPYYYYDSVYYRPYSTGYIVVPAPTAAPAVVAPVFTAVVTAPAATTVPVVTQPKTVSNETAVINIPNANGGYTPVILTKYKTGYIGPQGEYYDGHPTVAQLRVLYGK